MTTGPHLPPMPPVEGAPPSQDLSRLEEEPDQPPPPPPREISTLTPEAGSAAQRVRARLSSSEALRDAFILCEVLGPPVGLRTSQDRRLGAW